jgi:hypothetical protein
VEVAHLPLPEGLIVVLEPGLIAGWAALGFVGERSGTDGVGSWLRTTVLVC